MAVKHIDLDDCYTPASEDQDIVLSVEIGDGQEGSYSIFLGSKLVKSNAPARLGRKADLMGKNTIISATIVDELRETNWTSITVSIMEGGGPPIVFGPYKAQAEHHLDTVIYSLKLLHR